MAVPLLGQNKAEENTAPNKATEPIEVETAFLVYVLPNGQKVMTHEINTPIIVRRAPTTDEVWATMSVFMRDISAQQIAAMSAQASIQLQQQMAMEMMGQQQNEQIAAAIAAGRNG